MKNLTRTLAPGALLLAASLTLFGCSAPQTQGVPSDVEQSQSAPAETNADLDRIIDEINSQKDMIMDSAPGMYTDVRGVAEYPSTVIYEYVYAEAVDPSAAEAGFEQLSSTLQELSDSTLLPEMEKAGITDNPQVTYRYLNPNGDLVWEKTYSASR